MLTRILIAEDEAILRESMSDLLSSEGYEVVTAGDGRAALEAVLDQPVDLVLTDIHMPELDGVEFLERLRKTAPETPVIMITAYGTVQSAVEALQKGAADYLLKPVNFDDLLVRIGRALEIGAMSRNQRLMTDQLAAPSSFENLVGESAAMHSLFGMVRKLSQVKSSVLVVGESGTGKELMARAVHYNGPFRDKPFVAVNCGAIPESLIESELFGHRRGAFTGAHRDKVGYFEAAAGGTLFLDEISTLPLAVQSALLRVLQERVVVPVGDTKPRAVDVRVIAASNRDLDKMVAAGEFREDLLYRLNVVKLVIPPLRERKEDIPQLAYHFLNRFTKEMNKPLSGLTNGAMRAMLAHPWRGNVRELENVIERAVIFAEGEQVTAADLPFGEAEQDEADEDLKQAMRYYERHHIVQALRRHGNDKVETAKSLGIGLSSLYRKLDELEIPKDLDEGDAAEKAEAGR